MWLYMWEKWERTFCVLEIISETQDFLFSFRGLRIRRWNKSEYSKALDWDLTKEIYNLSSTENSVAKEIVHGGFLAYVNKPLLKIRFVVVVIYRRFQIPVIYSRFSNSHYLPTVSKPSLLICSFKNLCCLPAVTYQQFQNLVTSRDF